MGKKIRNGKKIILVTLLSTVFVCGGCQQTPKEKAVIDKSKGLADGVILDVIGSDEEKKVEAPEHWKELLENEKGFVTIEADVDLNLPIFGNSPIWQIKQKGFTNSELKELGEYFINKNPIYQVTPKTKAELEVQEEAIKNKIGYYGIYDSKSSSEILKRCQEKIEQASQINEKKEEVTYQFGEKTQTEMEYVIKGDESASEKKQKTFFRGETTQEDGKNVWIEATTYNESAGTNSTFTYSCGGIYTEDDWQYENGILPYYSEIKSVDWIEKYQNYIDGLGQKMNQKEISEQEAIKISKQILEDLKIDGMEIVDTIKGVYFSERSEWGRKQDADFSWGQQLDTAEPGYMFTYTRKMGGVLAQQPSNGGSQQTPEEMYYPPFYQEDILIFVTKSGVRYFSWENMGEKTAVIAENTKLLPFDKIKENLLKHVSYVNTSPNPEENDANIMLVSYTVNSAKLMAAYCPAFENAGEAWLVPTWVFEVESEVTLKQKDIKKGQKEVMMINAIDGSFIQNGPQYIE